MGLVALHAACSVGALLVDGSALAHRIGIPTTSCEGCHSNHGAELAMTGDPAILAPGAQLTVTLTIQHPGGTTVSGGLYVAKPAVGQLVALPGEDLNLLNDELVHALPKAAQGGVVTFHFGWRAPNQPGAVRFQAYGLAANGDGTPNGDYAGTTEFDTAFGCTLQEFFPDADGDGYGNSLFVTAVGCMGQPPTGYVARGGDCSDGDPTVHPGAVEICNKKDDNCDGNIDENAPPVAMWPDDDNDGYYQKQTGTPVMGCGSVPGYASVGGDCAPKDPNIHPFAKEICNGVDDNCDGRVDEGVRPTCGVGFCQRESQTCSMADCNPGVPIPEDCNLLDDDCDGIVDNGNLCAAGQSCQIGKCVAAGSEAPGASQPGTGGSGAGARTGAGAGGSGLGQPPGTGGATGGSPGANSSGPGSNQAPPSASGCGVGPGSSLPDSAASLVLLLLCIGGARQARRARRILSLPRQGRPAIGPAGFPPAFH